MTARVSKAGGFTTRERWRWTVARQREHIDTIAQQSRPLGAVQLYGDVPILRGCDNNFYHWVERPSAVDCNLMRYALALLEQRGIDIREVSHVENLSRALVNVHLRDRTIIPVTIRGS